ncbi:hypothetical protein TRFO_16471 [Tritrichomonas foetus]|uniref:Spindle assembly abnormal protein 6 N-terminal domain-containing protein n=1 Tax=Tritrichomonas foetus TaxID=1144522 RepID=A0A1J4KQ61_9EUKA|nr:hypothetical protein TRFO_16471 [Tritrichomonas foetus]|eukprot:OHT13379.1 hypothetical protein TRFO_16471 [Tritrichomonas foetus]
MSEFTATNEDFNDPSLQGGGEIIFNNEVPVAIKSENDEEEDNATILVRIKIIVVNGGDDVPQHVRLEMLCDSDLFFLYEAEYAQEDFEILKKTEGLTIKFEEFPQLLVEIIEQYITEPDSYSLLFEQQSEEQSTLRFQQQLKFKLIDILALDLKPASEEFVKDSIQYRYNAAKAEIKAAHTELNDLYALLKIKNPTVLKKMTTRK